jgi:hypothetical protein
LATPLLFAERAAQSYPTPVDFDGSLMRWDIGMDAAPITYETVATRDQDLTLFGGAVDDAARLWTDVPSAYFAYALVGPETKAQVTVHLDSTIDGSEFSAGYAVFDEYDGTSPSHCSIHIPVDGSVTLTGFAKTVLHELGHCAGLGHTLIPEAIMSYSLDKNSFTLDVDDEAALTRLYPADGSTPKLPPGCSAGATGASGVVLLLLGVPLLTARLRPRRGG